MRPENQQLITLIENYDNDNFIVDTIIRKKDGTFSVRCKVVLSKEEGGEEVPYVEYTNNNQKRI